LQNGNIIGLVNQEILRVGEPKICGGEVFVIEVYFGENVSGSIFKIVGVKHG